MLILILFIASVILGFCLTEGQGRKTFAAGVLALLYLPIGVVLALSKKYR